MVGNIMIVISHHSTYRRGPSKCTTIYSYIHLHLPLQQSPKEVEAITVTLQLPHPPRRPIIPPKFLRQQQSIVPCDALNPRLCATFLLQSYNLVHVQPVVVVHLFESLVEAGPEEPRIQLFVCGDDSREEFL